MSKEGKQHYKQPKRETTLARLTRQTRAIHKLVNSHNRRVAREVAKLERAVERLATSKLEAGDRMSELNTVNDQLRDLILVGEE